MNEHEAGADKPRMSAVAETFVTTLGVFLLTTLIDSVTSQLSIASTYNNIGYSLYAGSLILLGRVLSSHSQKHKPDIEFGILAIGVIVWIVVVN